MTNKHVDKLLSEGEDKVSSKYIDPDFLPSIDAAFHICLSKQIEEDLDKQAQVAICQTLAELRFNLHINHQKELYLQGYLSRGEQFGGDVTAINVPFSELIKHLRFGYRDSSYNSKFDLIEERAEIRKAFNKALSETKIPLTKKEIEED